MSAEAPTTESQGTVFVLNCGSSSLKYQLLDPDSERVLASGLVERIGEKSAGVTHRVGEDKQTRELELADHEAALVAVDKMFAEFGPDLSAAGISAVGHRVVHGGPKFSQPVRIDDAVLAAIEELAPLAPLHNPPALDGIRAAMSVHDEVPHVAVFDTAFFSDLPAAAYTYALDSELAAAHHIRRYGFHGTSHDHVSHAAADFLGADYATLKQIVLHLGNGASASAITGGVAVETSMGLTPLEGLVMGTRPGDLDPGLPAYLNRQAGYDVDELDSLLNKKSGLLGLTGVNDFREVVRRAEDGDERASLAFEVVVHRLVAYVGAYLAQLGGVDVLTFTAGIGENSAPLRAALAERLAPLGFELDAEANQGGSGPRRISTAGSPVTMLVVPTNEELAIARQTLALVRAD